MYIYICALCKHEEWSLVRDWPAGGRRAGGADFFRFSLPAINTKPSTPRKRGFRVWIEVRVLGALFF